MALKDPNTIKFIFQNYADPQTRASRGWTIGYLNGTKEIVPDNVGADVAKVMEERGKREYKGILVKPNGDPLTEVMRTGIKIDMKELDEKVIKKNR